MRYPNNLLPYIAQVAVGRLSRLTVHGGDYPTIDGTGVRDYIHVCDLAAGHARALEYLRQGHGYHVWNLGTGTGYSVLQIIELSSKSLAGVFPLRCRSPPR
ncbi:NAD-dependent epimerase/dehydratase family protein [Pseudomonas aeruginosa]|nr:NAD-dependent epimerase/dehydratase family protein [Pseudomonas aeruginosa]